MPDKTTADIKPIVIQPSLQETALSLSRINLRVNAAHGRYKKVLNSAANAPGVDHDASIAKEFDYLERLSIEAHLIHLTYVIAQEATVANEMLGYRVDSGVMTAALTEQYLAYSAAVRKALGTIHGLLAGDDATGGRSIDEYRGIVSEVIQGIDPNVVMFGQGSVHSPPIFCLGYLAYRLRALRHSAYIPTSPSRHVSVDLKLSQGQSTRLRSAIPALSDDKSSGLSNRYGQLIENFKKLDADKSYDNQRDGVLVHPVKVRANEQGYIVTIGDVEIQMSRRDAVDHILLT